MIQHELVLATDLDGTFLGGSESARRRLFEILNDAGRRVRLIFVTGRGLETVLPVLSDPFVPTPDLIVADVGATVVRGRNLEPVIPIQSEIAARWPGNQVVLKALRRFAQLERQDVPQERRCSFYVESGDVNPDLERAVRAIGCDLLVSGGRFLDILPPGVSKGSTLMRLLEQEGINPESVVVAGDTMNDLSLFELGLKGIVVGEAEDELVRRVAGSKHVFTAGSPGAGGILDGLCHHGFIPPASADLSSVRADDQVKGESRLVIVYHRLPFDEVREASGTVRRSPKSPNGIIPTLLGFFSNDLPGSWVAWSQQESRSPAHFDVHVPVDEERYPGVTAARVPLTSDDVELFYKRFSKEAFWPIIFSFPDKAEFNHEHWQHYIDVNRIFAEQAAREAAPGALVWVHDYNLWLVPAHLRKLRPDVKIAFFHHTAFPHPDVFNILPWRREILGSLLSCDYVGFHIPRYVENFVDAVRSHAPTKVIETTACAPRFMTYGCALGVDSMTTRIEVSGRTVGLGAHPVGIDLARLDGSLAQDSVKKEIETIRRELSGRLCVLSVERLDYVKGPIEKLLAFERLLDKHPELHGRVVMINVVTPPAPGMEVYETIRGEVDQVVGRINGRFSKLDWTPVRYFFRSLSYDDVLASCAIADVAWITPLRDGLNLVAKEFVAAKAATNGAGVLVLSEFAGAAVELHGAMLTNPYDGADMEEALYRALTVLPAERAERMRRLTDIVRGSDVVSWGKGFLDAALAST